MKKLLMLIFAFTSLGLYAQEPEVMTPTQTGVSDAFRNYARANTNTARFGLLALQADGDEEAEEVPNTLYIPRGEGSEQVVSGASRLSAALAIAPLSVSTAPSTMYVQTTNGSLPVTKITDYVGLGIGFPGWANQGLFPPDTTMAVGNNQIVQWVNVKLTVLNKTTGANLLGGFVNGSQIWSGLTGSLCATANRGDPVLQYDRLAGRWFLSQFAFNGNGAAAPFAMCFAVSQTSDATGAYNLYQFSVPNLPDYPKIGVWPDAYYWTANDFANLSFAGSRVCALDRTAMLAGNSATQICFSGLGNGTTSTPQGSNFAMVPGDFEGTILPAPGTPAYIMNNDWFTKNNPPYDLTLRRFHVDFATPGNSTFNDGFGGAFNSFVDMPFATNVVGSCGDAGGACVQQPGTSARLDSLSMRAMYRLAYRNLGQYETLVFTESVDPTGAAVAGIQLVEIRNPGANPPTVYNNVNLNPDTTNRWMGSAATDKNGNVLLGYSVSSTSKNPSIRIAGRLRTDIKSTLRGEIEVKTGTGSQTGTSSGVGRWGDYSTMQIDPDNDCTFWYTQEYMSTTGSTTWSTHIVGYKFNSCQ